MATLLCQAGDPDYLKIVLLKEIVKIREDFYTTKEGNQLTLVLEDGRQIFSANEICRLLCIEAGKESFAGFNPVGVSLVDHWLDWEVRELKPSVFLTLSSGTLSEGLLVCLGRLESHLSTCGGQYLVQDGLSFADVVVWSSLYVLLAPEAATSQNIIKEFPLISSWFISLSKTTHFSDAVWKASDDLGYGTYLNFLMGKGRSSVMMASLFPLKLSASSQQRNVVKNERNVSAKISLTENDALTSEELTPMELEVARKSWEEGIYSVPRPIIREAPILPIPGERNVLITSALPYVNNVPHLGNIIGCVLSADVFARYCRLRNYCTLYICGTDEYGTATETKALEEGLTPQEICRKYHSIHCSIYEWFNIKFDYFGRTSTPEQTEIAQDIFWRLHEREYICKDTVDQLLCQKCNMFLADRFVEGTCPLCGYEDARGDQCDKCGKLINATELKSPRCKVCSSSPVVKTSDHLFLDLSKLEPSVKKWYEQSTSNGIWSANSMHITSSWLRDGLKPRCISRDLKWGTPVPLEGYTDKVFYVWFDAPIGYLSITACYTKEWEKWWKNPEQVQLYQFMAKDNVPFHAIVFPCSLVGAEDNYTLLNHMSSTEYLNYEDGKFSKSRGVGVFGDNARESNIPADVFRFYLLYIRPETQDSAFSWSDFVIKHNSELLNNMGNFINRVLVFTKSNFNSIVQNVMLEDQDLDFMAKVNRAFTNYIECLENIKIRDGLRHILTVSRLGNVYIQANKPWVLVKGTTSEYARAGSVLGLTINVVCMLSVMIQPYMPSISEQIQQQLKAPEDCNVLTESLVQFLPPGHRIGTPSPLFTKIEEATIQQLKEKFAGKQMAAVSDDDMDMAVLQEKLDKQAAHVRGLKSQGGVPREKIDAEVKVLLNLKSKMSPKTTRASGKGKK